MASFNDYLNLTIKITDFVLPNACSTNNQLFNIHYDTPFTSNNLAESSVAPYPKATGITFNQLTAGYNIRIPSSATTGTIFLSGNCIFCSLLSATQTIAILRAAQTGNSTSETCNVSGGGNIGIFTTRQVASQISNLPIGSEFFSDGRLTLRLTGCTYVSFIAVQNGPRIFYILDPTNGKTISTVQNC